MCEIGAAMIGHALIAALVNMILAVSVSLLRRGQEGLHNQVAKTFNEGANDRVFNLGTSDKTNSGF